MDPVNIEVAGSHEMRYTNRRLTLPYLTLPAKFEVRSFTRSWDNRGHSKKLGSPWIRPHSLFSEILKGFCSDGPCEYTYQI